MSNQIFQALGGAMPQNPMMQQFPKFMQMMRGKDPNQMLNDLVSSGRVDQAHLNAAQKQYQQMGNMLNQFKSMFGF